jgi:hypothetical protein
MYEKSNTFSERAPCNMAEFVAEWRDNIYIYKTNFFQSCLLFLPRYLCNSGLNVSSGTNYLCIKHSATMFQVPAPARQVFFTRTTSGYLFQVLYRRSVFHDEGSAICA